MLATRLEDPRRLADARHRRAQADGCASPRARTSHRVRVQPGRGMIRLPGLAWLRDVRWLCCGPSGAAVCGLGAMAGNAGARGRVQGGGR
jgi:hypothetical protein